MAARGRSVRIASEERTLDRFFKRHSLAIFGLIVVGVSVACSLQFDEIAPWGWWAAAGGCVVALLGFFWLDNIIAVFRLWETMTIDAEFWSAGSGVPGMWLLCPGLKSAVFAVERSALTDDEIKSRVASLGLASPYERADLLKIGKNWARVRFTSAQSALDKKSSLPVEIVDNSILVGLNSLGKKAYMPLAGGSGAIVGGVPGSGKTYFLRRLVSTLGRSGNHFVVVLDGKSSRDFDDLVGKNVRVFGGVPYLDEEPLKQLEKIEKVMERRAENGSYSAQIVLVVDECQGFTDSSGLYGDEKKAVEKSAAILRRLVQKGRSLGIFVVLSTQKPDGSSVPTKLRDNLGVAMCFRVKTAEAGKTVLGDNGAEAMGLPVGVGVLDDGNNRDLVKVAEISS